MSFFNFGNLPQDRLAVDFSGNQIKIVYGKAAEGKVKVQDVFSKKLSQGTDEEFTRELLEFLKANKISAKEAVCVVPSKLFISKNVEIPSTEREEIAKIIDLQAGRFTPYSRDEIVIDFVCMETPNQHYTSVLLIIVNRALVGRYCRIFDTLGIPVKIRIASEALALTASEFLGPAGTEGATLGGLVVGDDATDFTIMDRHQIVFVRSLPVGADHFRADANLAVTELISELGKSLTAYRDQGLGKPIRSLMLTGLIQNPDFLKGEILRSSPVLQRFGTEIQIQESRLLFPASPEALQKLEDNKQISFTDLAAVLFKADQCHVDLIPKEVKLKRKIRAESREITSLGITLMTIFIILCLSLYSKIYFKNVRLDKLVSAGKSTFEEARMLERISTKNRVVRRILANRGKALSTFDEVTGGLGESTYLSSFTYNIEGILTLTGTTETMSQVFALVNRLEVSNRYKRVKAVETKSRREGSRDVADFVIECILPDSPAAEKIDAEKMGVKPAAETKKPE